MSDPLPKAPASANPSPAKASPELRGIVLPMWVSRWWLLVLALAAAELVALVVRTARVARADDWEQASAFVHAGFERGDAITAAPSWADPTLRLYLGDKITTKIAGRSDLTSFERLWVVSIRGARAREEPPRAPDLQRAFGRVLVSRYDFGPTPEVLDLVDALPQARVTVQRNGRERPCPFNPRSNVRAQGGLSGGPVYARQRFQCDPRAPWNNVGVTVVEDLDLEPRRCVWQHPVGKEPVSVTYHDVHLGTHLVLHAGLYYHDEREKKGADVMLRVLVDGRPVARLVHHDGDGFRRYEVDTLAGRPADAAPRGELRLEVTTDNSYHRSFCWAGSIRDAERREGP